jgi:hypothetical protein
MASKNEVERRSTRPLSCSRGLVMFDMYFMLFVSWNGPIKKIIITVY